MMLLHSLIRKHVFFLLQTQIESFIFGLLYVAETPPFTATNEQSFNCGAPIRYLFGIKINPVVEVRFGEPPLNVLNL